MNSSIDSKKNYLNVILFLLQIILVIYLAMLSLSAMYMTPLKMGGADATVFSVMGFSWNNGSIPYRDLFDHKGPLIYLINAISYFLFDEFYGIVFIEIALLSITFLFFFFINKRHLLVAIPFLYFFIKNSFLPKDFEGGNLTEEYAIFLNFLSIICYLRKTRIRFYVYGVIGLLCFFLRPNLAAITLSIFFIELLKEKSFKNFIECLIGGFIVAIPTLLYFYFHNALYDFYNSYFIFNLNYSSENSNNIFDSYKHFILRHKLLFVYLILSFFLIGKYKKEILIECLFIFIFSFFMCSVSGRTYGHYFMMTTPAVLLISTRLFEIIRYDVCFESWLSEKIVTKPVLALVCFCVVLILGVITFNKTIKTITTEFNFTNYIAITKKLTSYGISKDSKLINLSNHEASRIFYLVKSVPEQVDFFPETAHINDKLDFGLENNSTIETCSFSNYDLIVLSQDKFFAKDCNYTLIKIPYFNFNVYKVNK